MKYTLLQDITKPVWEGDVASTGSWSHTITAGAETSTYQLAISEKPFIFDEPIVRHLHDKQYELTDHLGNVRAVVSAGLEYNPVGKHVNPRVIATNTYYPFGMLIGSLSGNSEGYRYGFNGKEIDSEFIGTNNYLNFGDRLYDSRICRFPTLDKRMKQYPFLSPYCYAANNPILFVDYNGEGPRVKLLRLLMAPQLAVSNLTDLVIETSVSATVAAGLGVFMGAGATASGGIAMDPGGNIGLVLKRGVFADLFSAFGGPAYNGVEEGNIALGAVASAQLGLTFHNKGSVLDLGGKSLGSAGVSFDIGEGFAFGIEKGEASLGGSLGYGIGAAISMIGTENFVFATTLDDLEQFEDAYIEASKYAETIGGDIGGEVRQTGKSQVSIFFNVTKNGEKGKEKPKQFEAVTLRVDVKNNAIYTGDVEEP